MADEDVFTAFISYSRADLDIAQRLQRDLENFRVPHKLVGTAGRYGKIPSNLGRVFLDRTDLSAAPQITEEIALALKRTGALIVLCSSDAAEPSGWVNREIEAYRRLRPDGRVFAVIVRDEPPHCFPPELLKASSNTFGSHEADQPLAADLRKEGDGPREAVVKLVAGLLGIDFDFLRRRHAVAQRRRTNRLIAIGLVYALIVTGALFWVATSALNLRDSRRVGIAAQARAANQAGRYDLGLLFAAAAMVPRDSLLEHSPATADAAAIQALLQNDLVRVVRTDAQLMALDRMRSRAYVARYGGKLRAFELPSGRSVANWQSPVDGIQALALSLDGKNLALATQDGLVVVLDPSGGNERERSKSAKSAGRSIAFSPIGDLVAMGSEDGYARVFDLSEDRWISQSPKHVGAVLGAAFSADGKRVLSGSYGTSLVEWDAKSGDPVRSYPNNATIAGIDPLFSGAIWAVDFALKHGFTLKSSFDANSSRDVDLPDATNTVALSEDLQHLVASTWVNKSAYVIESLTNRIVGRLQHPEWVYRAEFFDGDKYILSLARDGFLRIWRNPAIDRPNVLLRFAKAGPTTLAWRPGTQDIVATGWSNAIATIDTTAKGQAPQFPLCANSPSDGDCSASSIAISPAGDKAVVGTQNGLLVMIDLKENKALWSRPVKGQSVLAVAFSPDDKTVASRLSGGQLELSRVEDGETITHFTVDTPSCDQCVPRFAGIAFDPSGKFVAETASDFHIRRLSDGATVWHSTTFANAPMSAAWSPNGRFVAAGASDNTIHLFTAFSDEAPRIMRGHNSWVTALRFSPDSRFLLASSDKDQILWDVASGEEILRFDPEGSAPSAGVFSPDGSKIAVSDTSGVVKLISLNPPDGDLKARLCSSLPEGQKEFPPQDMVEFSFLEPQERDPCSIPSLLSWPWIKTSFLNMLNR